MKPLPWSFSSLSDFKNCPRAFYEKRITKNFRDEETEALRWGNAVHKAFELRQLDQKPLPPTMAEHEPFMQELEELPGKSTTETKVALNRKLEPCGFFDEQVWYRGVVDFQNIHDGHALLVDYKTGKAHSKFEQLAMFAVHTFVQHPDVETVTAQFYWTQTSLITDRVYQRADIGSILQDLAPDLRQYVEAFRTDTWQPRPSGLCGWCPVTSCEHWRPRRRR